MDSERARVERIVAEEFPGCSLFIGNDERGLGLSTIAIRDAAGEFLTKYHPMFSWADIGRRNEIELRAWIRGLAFDAR